MSATDHRTIGRRVEKADGSTGEIRAALTNKAGELRYAVEHDAYPYDIEVVRGEQIGMPGEAPL